MGKQINFYMHPDDILEFEEFIRSKKLLFFKSESSSLPIRELDSLQISDDEKSEDTLRVVICSKYESDIFSCSYNIKKNKLRIDVRENPVVEFSRCFIKDNIMRSGRLFFIPKDPAFLEENSEYNFSKWPNTLINWIRRRYTKLNGIYYSPQAINWCEHGGEVSAI